MKFWSKSSKHGEKKLSREKQASVNDGGETHGKKRFFICRAVVVKFQFINLVF